MEKYKLKKDTFFYKAGTICKLMPEGNMVVDVDKVTLLFKHELDEHPELLDEWFEKIEEKKYGGRVPKEGDKYWYIFADGEICDDFWNGTKWDMTRFETGSAFWTHEEAEKELRRREAYVILKEDTKGFKPNWKENISLKYYVLYRYDGFGGLRVTFTFSDKGKNLYFKTREDAEASIKNHRQQWVDFLDIEEEI